MTVSETEVLPKTPASAVAGEQCNQCGAPAENGQRYCVVCGAKRRHVDDPAASYLATRTSRSRAAVSRRAARPPGSRGSSLALALVIAVIPLAVGLGVLVGRASMGGDGRLIAALRAEKPEIINTGGGSGSTTAASRTQPVALSSNFPLAQGYAVELRTLPGSGTDQATVNSAEAAARAKGATGVGLISQQSFSVTPRPPSGAYVIYSGAFTARSAAEKALAKLRKRFPTAIVIRVGSLGAVSGAGQVLSKTSYGSATQIAGLHVTKTQLSSGKQVVQHIQQTEGKSYVNAQRGLPSQISIP